MRIKIKTDPETLFLIHTIVKKEMQMTAANMPGRSQKSVRIELFEILSRRCMAYTLNANGKPVSFTLRYHLAHLVYVLICENQRSFPTFEANKLEILKNTLHQKLL